MAIGQLASTGKQDGTTPTPSTTKLYLIALANSISVTPAGSSTTYSGYSSIYFYATEKLDTLQKIKDYLNNIKNTYNKNISTHGTWYYNNIGEIFTPYEINYDSNSSGFRVRCGHYNLSTNTTYTGFYLLDYTGLTTSCIEV